MVRITSLLSLTDRRIELLRDGEVGEGPLLLWVQRAQRARGNLAANLAIELANELNRPVVACFCLAPSYPAATDRSYHFMAEGLRGLPAGFAGRGVGWILRVGDPIDVIPKLSAELNAAAVVTDQAPTALARTWKARVSQRIAVPMVAVDADVVIPTSHFDKLEWAARTIRPKIERLLDTYLQPTPDPTAMVRSETREAPDPFALLDDLNLDRRVGPVDWAGGEAAARERLVYFCDRILPKYATSRDQADLDGTSRMSAYLHFGQISPLEIALAARQAAEETGASEALTAFFNELIVQRELAINFALHEPKYDTFEGIPEWGKKTLAKHAHDPRPELYSAEQLETGETHDPLWNAAQRQMVAEGYMPNRLRMYWAKQILLWSRDAETAFEIARTLNDRYFIDGRDPNGYAGISWSIGGRHDRPFPPEKAISGLVRRMGMPSMKKYFDVDRYISDVNSSLGGSID